MPLETIPSTAAAAQIPICTAVTLRARNGAAVKPKRSEQPGISRTYAGHLQPNFAGACSLLLIRRAHREKRQLMRLQFGKPAYYDAYRTTHYDFAIARIAWDTGTVTELAEFPTRSEAIVALRQMTKPDHDKGE